MPALAATHGAESLATWTLAPADWKGAAVSDTSTTLAGDKWSHLRAPRAFANVTVHASVTLTEPAKTSRFFGQGWSA